jgi:hypothetical protein
MTVQRRFKRMLIEVRDGLHFLQLGEMEIWDGADLALLREGLFQLIAREDCEAIVIDMSHVKYIPSGFFGMLFDWQEKAHIRFSLTMPQPNVQRMLWFRQFFKPNADGLYEMQNEASEEIMPVDSNSETCLTGQPA